MTTLSGREFHQDTSRAKTAAAHGTVFITDRGQPAHGLLRMDDYVQLAGPRRSILDALSTPGLSDIDVAFPCSRALPQAADIS